MVATCVGLTVATLGGEPYETIVPVWLGTVTVVLPGFAGITAVVAAWRGGRD